MPPDSAAELMTPLLPAVHRSLNSPTDVIDVSSNHPAPEASPKSPARVNPPGRQQRMPRGAFRPVGGMTAPHHRGRYLDRYFGRSLRRNARNWHRSWSSADAALRGRDRVREHRPACPWLRRQPAPVRAAAGSGRAERGVGKRSGNCAHLYSVPRTGSQDRRNHPRGARGAEAVHPSPRCPCRTARNRLGRPSTSAPARRYTYRLAIWVSR